MTPLYCSHWNVRDAATKGAPGPRHHTTPSCSDGDVPRRQVAGETEGAEAAVQPVLVPVQTGKAGEAASQPDKR